MNATILGIEKDEANGQVFNVGYGKPTTVLQVVNELMKNYGIEVPVKISSNFRIGDIRHNYADLTKIKSLLGFEPKVSFEEGVAQFSAWVNNQEIGKDNFDNSIRELKEKGLFK